MVFVIFVSFFLLYHIVLFMYVYRTVFSKMVSNYVHSRVKSPMALPVCFFIHCTCIIPLHICVYVRVVVHAHR